MSAFRRALRALGKGDRKVTAVFAADSRAAARAVAHLRAGIDLPIFLFTLEAPDALTAAECERVVVGASSVALWWRAQRALWPYWPALSVGQWTGKSGNWLLKAAPLCIPPFRTLILNENDDLFAGSVPAIGNHASRRLRELRGSAKHRCFDMLRGIGLFGFANIAQACSPLSRFAFGQLKREMALEMETPAPSGEGMARFAYKNRDWNHAALRELLARTEARWILFERAGTHEPAEELLAPFADPNTFAVSRQAGIREWRKLLFATAPFRALQLGERTRVLAPVSPQMLVDRQKLLALGIPALSSFGSSWFLLFWKAAAAGWPSYSVGSREEQGCLAAVPFEEAEFVKTLLDGAGLRRLKPREPALLRGSIAQSATTGPGFRDLPRVLILSPYLPYPVSHGGAVRIYNLCRCLADRVDFVLACFREKGETINYSKLHEIFREVYVVDVDEKPVDSELPKQVREYESSSMRALVGQLCREKQISVLQTEYTQMAAYREAAPETPAILVEHDLTFTLYGQLAERDPSLARQTEYVRWLNFERERLRAFDVVWTMSELDRERAIAEDAAPEQTVAIPNGVDLQRFCIASKTEPSEEILYVGSFRHGPNYLGFDELRRNIMPEVWRQFPAARLRVVAGPDHLKHWPGSKDLDSRITVHGFVEDLLPFYREASLVVAPLPVSAGTNIKVMEALACERAVISTPVGCAGLELRDGVDAVIRDLGPDFSSAICRLLAQPALRKAIAVAGRSTAVARFSWESIANKAYESYAAVAPGRRVGGADALLEHEAGKLPATDLAKQARAIG